MGTQLWFFRSSASELAAEVQELDQLLVNFFLDALALRAQGAGTLLWRVVGGRSPFWLAQAEISSFDARWTPEEEGPVPVV